MTVRPVPGRGYDLGPRLGPAVRQGAAARAEEVGLISLAGRWRIVTMELWDTDAIDLVTPGFIEFDGQRSGRFGFIAVEGQLDCRSGMRDGRPCVEFTWEGSDDCDPASGRGWAILTDNDTLDGRIFFHLGDDSGFQAVRTEPMPSANRPAGHRHR
jgi:hypothetical protein